jgi:hypothetical protein
LELRRVREDDVKKDFMPKRDLREMFSSEEEVLEVEVLFEEEEPARVRWGGIVDGGGWWIGG